MTNYENDPNYNPNPWGGYTRSYPYDGNHRPAHYPTSPPTFDSVRLTHLPTGTVIEVRSEFSEMERLETAWYQLETELGRKIAKNEVKIEIFRTWDTTDGN